MRSVVAIVLLATAALGFALAGQQSSTTPVRGQPMLPGTTTIETLDVDGMAREAIVYVPASLRVGAPAPLVLFFHGGTWNAASTAHGFGLNEEAERRGFIAVYPDGAEFPQNAGTNRRNWNGGRPDFAALLPDDVLFTTQLLDVLAAKYSIDATRTYAMGWSNGAVMSYRLACELSARFAAVAAVAGKIQVTCEPDRPVSVIHIHGTSDPLAPYGATQDVRGMVPSAPEVAAFWGTQNGCASEPTTRMFMPVVEQQTYTSCGAGAEVALYTILEGFHCWPGREAVALRLELFGLRDQACPEGGPHMSFDATALIVEFLLAYPRTEQ